MNSNESDSSSAGDWTNKKRGPGEEIFRKSKKIGRSPQKKTGTEAGMEEIKAMLTNLTQELGMIKTKVNKLDKIEGNQNQLLKEVKELREENKELQKENEELKERVTKLETLMQAIGKKERRKNIVIKGVKIRDELKAKEEVEGILQNKLQVVGGVERVRVVETKKAGKLIIAEMKNLESKTEVMRARNKLKGTTIYLDDDLTYEERIIQKKIREIMKQERMKGNRATMSYRKLTINEEKWRWDNSTNQLVRLNQSKN